MEIIPVYGVFLKSGDKDVEDMMIFMAYSEAAADAKLRAHARFNNNFVSNYYYRRIDQQEYDDSGRLLYGGNENDGQ